LIVLCALVAALAIAAPASAACVSSSVTQDQYGDDTDRVTACNEAGAGAAAAGGTADAGSSGSLPFTGLDLGLMGGAAGALLVGGVLIRRRARAEGA
jgi:hypothetical protein